MRVSEILDAMRADAIPEGSSGPWAVRRWSIVKPLLAARDDGKLVEIQPGTHTNLHRWTDATLHLGEGELVMHDEPHELRKHLQFCLMAYGNVLVSGLGLGCVARGLLKNPKVSKVVVTENSPDVMKLVSPYMPKVERLQIILTDALAYAQDPKHGPWHCAWHDLWLPKDTGFGKLCLAHADLLVAVHKNSDFFPSIQGAWHFPRHQRRLWAPLGVI